MIQLLNWLGKRFLLSYPGELVALGASALSCLFHPPANRKSEFSQLVSRTYLTGVEAIPLVVFVALIIGTVTIVQAVSVMPKIGAGDYFGSVMVVVVIREMGPLFTAFLIAGRTGSALSTFLGNMKVQQEIDALRVMGINPTRYLIYPALMGTMIAMFGLTVLFNLTSILGGYFVVRSLAGIIPQFADLELSLGLFLERIFSSMSLVDGLLAIAKPVFFGMVISLISCYHGITVGNDTRQVPDATNRAVVNSFVFTIVFDLLFAVPLLRNLDIPL